MSKGLPWVDPALAKPFDDGTLAVFTEPAGNTKCPNCSRVLPFKDVYFDYCRVCVREAHPELRDE